MKVTKNSHYRLGYVAGVLPVMWEWQAGSRTLVYPLMLNTCGVFPVAATGMPSWRVPYLSLLPWCSCVFFGCCTSIASLPQRNYVMIKEKFQYCIFRVALIPSALLGTCDVLWNLSVVYQTELPTPDSDSRCMAKTVVCCVLRRWLAGWPSC